MQPHQQRVIDEKTELDAKLDKLRQFFTNPLFRDLPQDEKQRLSRQELVMTDYSDILADRIADFK